jgi:hypothetical protein
MSLLVRLKAVSLEGQGDFYNIARGAMGSLLHDADRIFPRRDDEGWAFPFGVVLAHAAVVAVATVVILIAKGTRDRP